MVSLPEKKVCAASSPTPNLRTDSCGQVSKYKKNLHLGTNWNELNLKMKWTKAIMQEQLIL